MILIFKLLLLLNGGAVIALIIYKSFRLPKATKQYYIKRWFYFDIYEIHARASLSEERMFQNRLS